MGINDNRSILRDDLELKYDMSACREANSYSKEQKTVMWFITDVVRQLVSTTTPKSEEGRTGLSILQDKDHLPLSKRTGSVKWLNCKSLTISFIQ